MRKTILMSALALALAGCAGGESDAEFNKLVAEAEAEIAVADKMGSTWRDTEKHLEDAKTAMKEGDSEKAMKLAKKALKEAKLAQQQAKNQANVKPWFPKN